jgi:hypothetical protein
VVDVLVDDDRKGTIGGGSVFTPIWLNLIKSDVVEDLLTFGLWRSLMSVDRSTVCTEYCVDFSFFVSFSKVDSDRLELLLEGILSIVVDGMETALSSLC